GATDQSQGRGDSASERRAARGAPLRPVGVPPGRRGRRNPRSACIVLLELKTCAPPAARTRAPRPVPAGHDHEPALAPSLSWGVLTAPPPAPPLAAPECGPSDSEVPLARLHGVEARSNPAPLAAGALASRRRTCSPGTPCSISSWTGAPGAAPWPPPGRGRR